MVTFAGGIGTIGTEVEIGGVGKFLEGEDELYSDITIHYYCDIDRRTLALPEREGVVGGSARNGVPLISTNSAK